MKGLNNLRLHSLKLAFGFDFGGTTELFKCIWFNLLNSVNSTINQIIIFFEVAKIFNVTLITYFYLFNTNYSGLELFCLFVCFFQEFNRGILNE